MGPSKIRGALISAKEGMIVLGMVAGYAIGYGFSTTTGGWRWTYGMVPAWSIVFGSGVYFLPESARFLLLNGHRDEGLESLKFIYSEVCFSMSPQVYPLVRYALVGWAAEAHCKAKRRCCP